MSIKKNSVIFENIYLFAFAILIMTSVIDTTTFKWIIPHNIYATIRFIGALIALYKICVLDKHTVKQLYIYILLLVGTSIITVKSTYSDMLFLLIYMIAAKNIKLKKIIRVYFVVTLIIVIIAIISSQAGMIENLKFVRPHGKLRQSFGIVYPTDFAAHIFYLILSYCYLKRRILFLDSMIFLSLALFIYIFCDARLDVMSIVLASIVFLFNRKIVSRIVKFILKYSIPICILISAVLVIMYKLYPHNNIIIHLNSALNSRLKLGVMAFTRYNITLFGNNVVVNGGTPPPGEAYFFIDCSYFLILLRYGLILFLVIMTSLIVVCKKYVNKNHFKIPLIIALIAMHSIVEQHFLELAYNPFIFSLVASGEIKNRFKEERRIIYIVKGLIQKLR